MEYYVEQNQASKQGDRRPEEEHCAKQERPNDQSNNSQELDEGDYDDTARYSILRADVSRSNLLLLAFSKTGNNAPDKRCAKEWEWEESNVVNGEDGARSFSIVNLKATWAETLTLALVKIETFRTYFADP